MSESGGGVATTAAQRSAERATRKRPVESPAERRATARAGTTPGGRDTAALPALLAGAAGHRPEVCALWGARSPAPGPARPQAAPAPAAEGPGEACDLVTVPVRQGLEAVDILRLREGVGPVLHDEPCDTLGFLVPPGTAEAWDLPGSACTRTDGRGLRLDTAAPSGGPAALPTTGADWLVPPEGAVAEATDPARLRRALGEAARTIEALDAM